MSQAHRPRRGSMQFWPRKRSKKAYARVRSWTPAKDIKALGFPGYKVGMTQILVTDNRANSMTKGEDITFPVTVIECPPMKVASVRFYKNTHQGLQALTEVMSDKLDKELVERKICKPKKINKKFEDVTSYDDLRLVVYTQPKLTGMKKKPEIFEVGIGGKKEEKLAFAKEKLGKEITISDVFKEGSQVDIHGLTKGKGFQGPVKRFGVAIRHHKSEKTKRGPGSLGAWKAQGHMMYRVAHAGKTGYNLRTQYNSWVMKIGTDPKTVNPNGGFVSYGFVKNNYILLKGSVQGPPKRLITMTAAIRSNKKIPSQIPIIQKISLESKQ